MKIGVIHATCNAVPPLNEAFRSKGPDVTLLNFVDENIQYHANQKEGIDDKTFRDFVNIATKAQEANVDIIVVACTVLTPIIEKIKPFINIPILAVDYPMLRRAIRDYKKIGVIATTAPSAPATKKQLEQLGENVIVDTEVNTQAMDLLKQGNVSEHNRLNARSASKLINRGAEVIVLAQITQASAKEE